MTDPRKACVLTTGRQDYGILRSTIQLLASDPQFKLQLLVGGMHLSARYGNTISRILDDGFQPTARLDWLTKNSPEPPIQDQMAEVVRLVGNTLEQLRPDFILLVGDRFETAAATLSAVIQRVPVVHLHGGEETEGALDNLLRHAITKMSHLHFVSHPDYAARIIQMGENPDSVHVVGAPGLDNLFRPNLPDKAALENLLGLELKPPVIIVTVHPVTARPAETSDLLSGLTSAMTMVEGTYIITLPNADPGNDEIRISLVEWADKRKNVKIVEALGEQAYFGLMRVSDAMVGNSSSGIIEAGVYHLPVVDIGSRQRGRLRGKNVIQTEPEQSAILQALQVGLSPEFRKGLLGSQNPYGDGHSGARILEILKRWSLPSSTSKVFYPSKPEDAKPGVTSGEKHLI